MSRTRSILALVAAATLFGGSIAWADHDDRGNGGRKNFFAFLDGYQEVPSVSTSAQGAAHVRVDRRDGTIDFVLRTGELEGEIWQAHLHVGRPGTAGGVAAFLCGSVALPAPIPPGTPACPPTSGGVVRGTIEAADVFGPAGQGIAPGEIGELIRAIANRSVYVNVHSEKFPAGEIRGQLR